MSALQRQPHGRWIRASAGYRAYVPDPLPPPIGWDTGLVSALSRADLALGRLAGEGRRMPNLHLLIRPFVRREAVLSSRIEGTQATLGELLPSPLLTLSAWFEAARPESYARLAGITERLGVAFTTAQRAIVRLETAGIVTLATEAKRNRVYCAGELLRILDDTSRARAAA